ncbi:MAG: DNA polymerase III subunit gamma/tau [Fibrobacteres bacterium]|jgi:DNA polymerase-3 subunit gamma/tau|nr:DNA polymerase III subunit gamma/tau [Fibrobacterota bacterium]
MAYLAMARKWRPKNFEDMVGQDHIAQTIRNAIEGKRISHAYLFTGTRGVGKTTSARILAKALNCKNGPTPIPCDACKNCKAVNAGSSLDVLEIDGASNNSVDDIRELRENVNYAPMNGSYKIYVIDEVHMLTKNAFNALLKTLEEPPPHVVFIFATTEVNKVPHTILSRVQRFDFKRISEQHIRERLEYICAREEIKAEREALEAVARKGDGSMRDALSLFDQVYAYAGADFTLEAARKVLGLPRESLCDGLIRALVQHDQKTCFASLQDALNEGIEIQDFLIAFGEYLRNMLFARQGVSPVALGLSEARYAELAAVAPELRDGDIIRFAKLISDILVSLKSAAHPRLAAELGLARMASLDRVVSLSQVLGAGGTTGGQAPSSAAESQPAPLRAAPDLAEVKKKSPEIDAEKGEKAAVKIAMPPTAMATPPASAQPASAQAFAPAAQPQTAVASARETAPLRPPASDPTAFEPGHVVVATLAPVRDLNPAEIDERLAPPIESEYGDPDPDYPADAEDPDAPPSHMAPTQPTAQAPRPPEDPVTVPLQASPAALPGLWPRLVAEFSAARPLVGSNLLRSRLAWEDGETPGLRVIFLERSAWSLVGEDPDSRKTIQAFLASKSEGGRETPVRFSLDPDAAASPAPAMAAYVENDPMKREPIIGFIQELFEGRLL